LAFFRRANTLSSCELKMSARKLGFEPIEEETLISEKKKRSNNSADHE